MLLSKWCNREWCWQWFKWSVIVLWSVVSHDYLKLMIECIVRIHVSVLVFACRWRWCVWELLSLVETCTYICVVVALVVWGVGWKKTSCSSSCRCCVIVVMTGVTEVIMVEVVIVNCTDYGGMLMVMLTEHSSLDLCFHSLSNRYRHLTLFRDRTMNYSHV